MSDYMSNSMLSRDTTYTNFIVFGEFKLAIYRTRREHVNNGTTNAVLGDWIVDIPH
jgi:hypothetical protein